MVKSQKKDEKRPRKSGREVGEQGDQNNCWRTRTGMRGRVWAAIRSISIKYYHSTSCSHKETWPYGSCCSVGSVLHFFFDAVTDLFGEQLQTADLEKMEKDLHRSLALLERDFPVNMQNIVSHFCITYFQK